MAALMAAMSTAWSSEIAVRACGRPRDYVGAHEVGDQGVA